MIRCITFDLDDTLWPVEPVIRHANQTMFDWLSEQAPAFTECFQQKDLLDLRRRVLSERPEIEYSVTKIRIAQLEKGLHEVGYRGEELVNLTRDAFEVFIEARQQVELFDGAEAMLSTLKQQGFVLGALSNGNADIHRVGLGHLIDFQFKADDVGYMKPHPEMFLRMLNYTGCKPHEVIHVGDNPEHDIDGANALGLKTIWMNSTDQTWSSTANKEVCSLHDIVENVAEIKSQAIC